MKTAFTPSLQFSGYPLQTTEDNIEKKLYAFSVSKEMNADYFLTIVINKVIDAPENWDEAWFGNYE